jgi:hypothetical protein
MVMFTDQGERNQVNRTVHGVKSNLHLLKTSVPSPAGTQ